MAACSPLMWQRVLLACALCRCIQGFGKGGIAAEEERLGEEFVLTGEDAQPVLARVYKRMAVGLLSLLCCRSRRLLRQAGEGWLLYQECPELWALPADTDVWWIKSLKEIDNIGKMMSLFRVVPDVVRTQKYLSCTDERKLKERIWWMLSLAW